ncbi:MAG: hypothetical protein AB3F67_4270 [Candidatus Phytoplasma solani]
MNKKQPTHTQPNQTCPSFWKLFIGWIICSVVAEVRCFVFLDNFLF